VAVTQPNQILTVPIETRTARSPLVTGNEWVALPDIAPENASLGSINLLHMASKSLIELMGAEPELGRGRHGDAPAAQPLLRPALAGRPIEGLSAANWTHIANWIPQARFTLSLESGDAHATADAATAAAAPTTPVATADVTITICAPVGERGFMVSFEITANSANSSEVDFRPGLSGTFGAVCSTVFSRRLLAVERHLEYSTWTKSLVLEARTGAGSLASLALGADTEMEWTADEATGDFTLTCSAVAAPGNTVSVTFWASVNADPDGAATTNVHLRRIGVDSALSATVEWLKAREVTSAEASKPAALERANRNLHFCRFFAHGCAIDTEELVLLTSRSPRYYVSAAFWARDTFLWAFPAMLASDAAFARQILETGFGRHVRNMGVHAHYIDGVLLYPGFELDELAAYVIALDKYIAATHDTGLLAAQHMAAGLQRFMKELEGRRHERTALYSTFLDPSDDPTAYPYLTYDNVLVWRALSGLSEILAEHGDSEISQALQATAAAVRRAIMDHCVVDGPFGPMFAWSIDLEGNYRLYDDPPGSLILLPWHGFVSRDNPAYVNTLSYIRSTHNEYASRDGAFKGAGCAHSRRPWPMHACNAVLAGVAEPEDIELLTMAPLDGGLACETVWQDSGAAATGCAFATAAGYLCSALRKIV
jgi:hypothetical protein